MSESCSGNCASCGSDCGERKAESLLAQLNPKSQVKKVIAVVSGKGGGEKHGHRSVGGSHGQEGPSGGHSGCGYHRPLHPQGLWRI